MTTASLTTFDTAPTLGFGKHRGVPLTEIETSYLEWVRVADRITPDLRTAIDTELATRAPKDKDRWTYTLGTISEQGHLYARMIIELGAAAVHECAGHDHHIGEAETLLQQFVDNALLHSCELPF